MHHGNSWQWSPSKVLSMLLLTVIAIYLVTEHTVHFFSALPYLLFLTCPLMMWFMMRGMHGGGGQAGPPQDQ